MVHKIADYSDAHPRTAPVGSYPAEHFGLFDLAGNVGEFCEDELPGEDAAGSRRLARGGSWESGVPSELHDTYRRLFATNECDVAYGFRLVRAPKK